MKPRLTPYKATGQATFSQRQAMQRGKNESDHMMLKRTKAQQKRKGRRETDEV